MIVKDEEADIQRCLDSVAPYIDYWVISDTGSSDNTMQKIQEIMDGHGVPGELHEHKWEDFSTNRNHVIRLARSKADYLWFMDADDNFVSEVEDPFADLPEEAEMFYFRFELNDGTLFERQAMILSSAPIIYHGVLHEFLGNSDMTQSEDRVLHVVQDCMIYARSSPEKRAATSEKKYLNDAATIKRALKDKNLNKGLKARYHYYLGVSYREAGLYKKALSEFQKRLNYGHFGESDERYLSLSAIAAIKKSSHEVNGSYSEEDVINCYLKCWEEFPSRIEPIVQLMDFLFIKRRHMLALMVAELPAKTAVACEQDVLHNKVDYTYNFISQCVAHSAQAGFTEHAIKMAENSLQSLEGKEKECMEDLIEKIKGL